jgi:cephalosporin hydroxylase
MLQHLPRKHQTPSSNHCTAKSKNSTKWHRLDYITFGMTETTFMGWPTINYIHDSRVQERDISWR